MKFKFDNPVFDFINTFCNFIALNVVFLLTCLPVVTIGTALSSLYYVTYKEANGEYGYLVLPYLKTFKSNLRSGTAAFLILFVSGAVLLFNVVFFHSLDTNFAFFITLFLLLVTAIWFVSATYTFPLIGRFENSTKQTLKNALGLALSNPKATGAIIFIDALAISLCAFLAPMKIFMLLTGFSFIAYCQCFIFKKVFAPYEEN